jgi:hypothetical protein
VSLFSEKSSAQVEALCREKKLNQQADTANIAMVFSVSTWTSVPDARERAFATAAIAT